MPRVFHLETQGSVCPHAPGELAAELSPLEPWRQRPMVQRAQGLKDVVKMQTHLGPSLRVCEIVTLMVPLNSTCCQELSCAL